MTTRMIIDEIIKVLIVVLLSTVVYQMQSLAAIAAVVAEIDKRQNRLSDAIVRVQGVQEARSERLANIEAIDRVQTGAIKRLQIKIFGSSIEF